MDAIEAFGPELAATMLLIAVAYTLLAFAPVWWPAIVVHRSKPPMPRRLLFVLVVAALVYGAFSFLAFAIILPVELYGIFVAPQLEQSGVAAGTNVLRVSGFLVRYWWLLVPPAQLLLTWYVTKRVGERWAQFWAVPPNHSFKPTPLRGAA